MKDEGRRPASSFVHSGWGGRFTHDGRSGHDTARWGASDVANAILNGYNWLADARVRPVLVSKSGVSPVISASARATAFDSVLSVIWRLNSKYRLQYSAKANMWIDQR